MQMIKRARVCISTWIKKTHINLSSCVCCPSAWIKVEQLKPYHAHKEEMIKINKGKRFQQAVDSVEDYLKKSKGKEQVRPGGR